MSNKFGHEKSNRRDIVRSISRDSAWSKSQAQLERIKFNTKQNKVRSSPDAKGETNNHEESQFPDHELHQKEDGSYVSKVYVFDESRWGQ